MACYIVLQWGGKTKLGGKNDEELLKQQKNHQKVLTLLFLCAKCLRAKGLDRATSG